ncbi:MAG: PD-(D/E)XK nuclease family protein [Candidatus Marinimicrobia bacterium]|nr:PD-(D/E)XK nuclease family protein [Candidatus Neomarinimicrobiota bacterium]
MKQILTFSAAKKFQSCQRAYYNRYRKNLVPLESNEILFLGSTVHDCLELWYKRDPNDQSIHYKIIQLIDEAYPLRESDENQKKDWHLAKAMMEGYIAQYEKEDFEIIDTELEFCIPIINPSTNRSSRTFELMGKVDALVKMPAPMQSGNELYFIMEHKTAALITGDYIEKLPLDFQINLYAMALSKYKNIPIAGVIYNVIQKSKIRQKQGESEEKFAARRQELIQKSKTGKTTAKRQNPESDEIFSGRLHSVYNDPKMFYREILYLSDQDIKRTELELWHVTQQILDAQRRGVWCQNTDNCFRYHSPCMYFPLCRAHDNPNVKNNLYTELPPHSELSVGSGSIF